MSLQQTTRDLLVAGVVCSGVSAGWAYGSTHNPLWAAGAGVLGLWAGPIVWAAVWVAVAELEWRLWCRADRRRRAERSRPVE